MLSFISLIYKQIIIQLYNWKQCCYYYFEHCYLLDQLKVNTISFYFTFTYLFSNTGLSLWPVLFSLSEELLTFPYGRAMGNNLLQFLFIWESLYSLILKDNFIRYRTLGGRGFSLSMFKIFSLHSLLFAQFLRRIQM